MQAVHLALYNTLAVACDYESWPSGYGRPSVAHTTTICRLLKGSPDRALGDAAVAFNAEPSAAARQCQNLIATRCEGYLICAYGMHLGHPYNMLNVLH